MFSSSNSLATPLGSTVMSPMGENGLAPIEGGSESPSRVIHGTEYFVLVIFDGINLSTASTKPVLNLTHMSLNDM